MIYSQLGIKRELLFSQPINNSTHENTVLKQNGRKHEYVVFQHLTDKIINEYQKIIILYKHYTVLKKSFFIGATEINPHKYKLIKENGEEISNIDTYLPEYNEYYIFLGIEGDSTRYFFIENEKIVKAPLGFSVFVDCSSEIGILGFKKEPIFITANEIGAIVIYPIAKNNFNWLENETSVIEIEKIILKTLKEFDIDKNNILIGGMSNGGKATFWFTQQEKNMFTGYFTFSGYPELKYKNIDFSKITKPFISVNSINDKTFNIDDVKKIYTKEKKTSPLWTLEILEYGHHGFIYDENIKGQETVTNNIKKLIN